MNTHPCHCPACGQPVSGAPFYSRPGVPVNSVILCNSRAEACGLARGEIALVCCPCCLFIFNRDYDPRLCRYDDRYEESQAHSGVFAAFHQELALLLIEQYGLRHRTILEIGCGKGDFLQLICRLGSNRGIGYDPAYVPARASGPAADQVRIHPCPFPKTYDGPAPDCIICKMTLEHIQHVHGFLLDIRAAIQTGQTPVVVLQVPDAEPILAERRFWDIYYEHCSYFTRPALAHLFARSGFQVLNMARVYDHQYFLITARPGAGSKEVPAESWDAGDIPVVVSSFARAVTRDIADWRDLLRAYHARGKKIALWGGGSKAVAFLTTLGITAEVLLVVDINPHKQNRFLPGTGHPVGAPAELARLNPDLVLIMNPVYREEIARQIRRMGLSPEVIPLDNARWHRPEAGGGP